MPTTTPRPAQAADHRDVALAHLAEGEVEWIEIVGGYRALVRVALAEVARLTRRLAAMTALATDRGAELRALRAEIERYTASACRPEGRAA